MLICQNYGHFVKKNEVSDRISNSLSQLNLRCPSPSLKTVLKEVKFCLNSIKKVRYHNNKKKEKILKKVKLHKRTAQKCKFTKKK